MPKPEMGKAELKAEFVRLRAKGLPYARIARRLGVAGSTLANWNAELEAEVASARALELEALQAEFFRLKEGRIRLLGEQLKRLRAELARRDLADVPTDKALDLLLKFHTALKEEFVEARPLSDREAARLRASASASAARLRTGRNWTGNGQRGDREGDGAGPAALPRRPASADRAAKEVAHPPGDARAREQGRAGAEARRVQAVLEARGGRRGGTRG